MARPIRETPILYGKDAERFVEEMKRVESLTPEQRKANREKLQAAIAVLDKEWNLTYNALRGSRFFLIFCRWSLNLTPCKSTESIPLGVPTDLQSGVKKGSTY